MKIEISGKIKYFVFLALSFTLGPSSLFASSLYYLDGSGTDIKPAIFDTYSCSGCHDFASSACTGTAVQTGFLGSYAVVAACIGDIRDKVRSSPTYGVQMPQGCSGASCLSAAHMTVLGTWDSNGEPLAPPSISTLSVISLSKTGATLRGSFNPNVWSGTSVPANYQFNWGLTTAYGANTSLTNATGTSVVTLSAAISGLSCETTYNYRGIIRNGGNAIYTLGNNVSFSTSPCSAPIMTEGTDSSIAISENNSPFAFSLTLNVTDDDPGTLSWSISSAASNGSAGVSGTGPSQAISYTPNLDYTGSDSFSVRVTNDSTTRFVDHIVNITVNADETFDASGYWTPSSLIPPDTTVLYPSATAVVAIAVTPDGDNHGPYGPYRPGHHIVTWMASNLVSGDLGTIDQFLDIRPLVNFAADQVTSDDNAVTLTVTAFLNGDPVVYPVSVNYSVSGTSDGSDHDATDGSFIISSPNKSTSFSFNVLASISRESDESVIFTMDSATNAAIGSKSVHTVTIAELNITPSLSLQIQQGGQTVGSAYLSEGTVTVDAIISDANIGQTLLLDWSGTDNSLSPPLGVGATTNWNFAPVAGNYLIDVVVTDDGSPARSNRLTRILRIEATAPTLSAVDSDGDGVNDDVEGFGDIDNDGIPNYLDDSGIAGHLIPSQTVDLTNKLLIQTEPGLVIMTGSTARASNTSGVIVSDTDVEDFGSNIGAPALNADDDFEHIGGVYDFEIAGLVAGSSATIVIPLQSPIPNSAVYRKFDSAGGWSTFSEDSQNQLASAIGEFGSCPEPGSSQYRSGLNFLDNCVQLTVQDGGANDADNIANGVIKDPGAVSLKLSDPVDPSVEGSGRMDIIFLIWLTVLAGFSSLIKKRNDTRC